MLENVLNLNGIKILKKKPTTINKCRYYNLQLQWHWWYLVWKLFFYWTSSKCRKQLLFFWCTLLWHIIVSTIGWI